MSSPNSRPIYEPAPMGWWERNIVPKLIGSCCAQPQVMKRRSFVVPGASGDVLELGCGGGINMEFYDPGRITSFSGVDPSPKLLDASRAAAQARGMAADIRAGIGEALPFDDAQFDTVVITYTLCSVHTPAQVQAEMRRVLRPGGKVLFLEHGRSPDAGVAKWQGRIEPIWKRIGGNCHLTRTVVDSYAGAGFNIVSSERGYTPKTPRAFGWMEWGEARVAI